MCQVLERPASLLFSCWCLCVGRERLRWWLHPLCMTQKYHLASMAAWLFSNRHFLPHSPPSYLLRLFPCGQQQISPCDCSRIPMLQLPTTVPSRDLCPCLGYIWLWQGLSVILIPFMLSLISCFTLSLKCFSPDTNNCPDVGIGPLLQFPHLLRAGPVYLLCRFSLLFLHPTEFCVVLYNLFWWSGTSACSWLVFCMHFCLCRCIPDVSMERDVLRVQLLLLHLVSVYLAFVLREKTFNFSLLSMMLPMGCHMRSLLCWDMFLIYHFWRNFYHEMLYFVNCFLCFSSEFIFHSLICWTIIVSKR